MAGVICDFGSKNGRNIFIRILTRDALTDVQE